MIWNISTGETYYRHYPYDNVSVDLSSDTGFTSDGKYLLIHGYGRGRGIVAFPYPTNVTPEVEAIPSDQLLEYACSHVFNELRPPMFDQYYLTKEKTCPKFERR